MIMRVFQVTTHTGKEAEFGRFFHETAIPLIKLTPGLTALYPGVPRSSSPRIDHQPRDAPNWVYPPRISSALSIIRLMLRAAWRMRCSFSTRPRRT